MHYNIFTTQNCNLNCRYCPDGKDPGSLPRYPQYTLLDLKKFLEKDEQLFVTFYGGEPLLNIKLVERIMDTINAKAFMMQTNGLLLHKLHKKHLKKLHTILLSIDGNEMLTDYYRGIGTYNRIIQNGKLVKNKGFSGELIARMTIDEKTDIYKEVKHLLRQEIFDSIHWQLNMCFFDKNKWKDPERWVKYNYNPGMRKLIEEWKEQMKSGKVQKIYPFIGIIHSLLHKQSTKLRCGAGWAFFNVLTHGSIAPCPNLRQEEFSSGNIFKHTPNQLRTLSIKEPCISCSYYYLCGGRCLVTNLLKPWGEEGFNLVCETVKNMIDKLLEVKPEIEEMVEKGIVSIKDFEYTKYNGCEIIP